MMVLKEAFRYQNVLAQWIDWGETVLSIEKNTTDTKKTFLFSKVKPDMEDTTEYLPHQDRIAEGRITELVEFISEIIKERHNVAIAIQQAKRRADVDIDVETSANAYRRNYLGVLRRMAATRAMENTVRGGGTGYAFNSEMNQVEIRCDVTEVTTINFDRNKVRKLIKILESETDAVSTKIDRAMVNTIVEHEPVFDMNNSMEDAFMEWLDNR